MERLWHTRLALFVLSLIWAAFSLGGSGACAHEDPPGPTQFSDKALGDWMKQKVLFCPRVVTEEDKTFSNYHNTMVALLNSDGNGGQRTYDYEDGVNPSRPVFDFRERPYGRFIPMPAPGQAQSDWVNLRDGSQFRVRVGDPTQGDWDKDQKAYTRLREVTFTLRSTWYDSRENKTYTAPAGCWYLVPGFVRTMNTPEPPATILCLVSPAIAGLLARMRRKRAVSV